MSSIALYFVYFNIILQRKFNVIFDGPCPWAPLAQPVGGVSKLLGHDKNIENR